MCNIGEVASSHGAKKVMAEEESTANELTEDLKEAIRVFYYTAIRFYRGDEKNITL